MNKILTALAVILAINNLVAQIYHEEDKEDLRIFMRQGANYEKLGLVVSDTTSWYENEEWVEKVKGITWIEAENFYLRIEEIRWNYLGLNGKLKFNSPDLYLLCCERNNLIELDLSKNINLEAFYCTMNNLIELDLSNNAKLRTLDCVANNLTELDLSNNAKLLELDCSYNNITKLYINKNIKYMSAVLCRYNSLKFSTLAPLLDFDIFKPHFKYSPQDTIYGGIKEYKDTIDLSSEYKVGGLQTAFIWSDITDGTEQYIKQPIDNGNGIFYFSEEHIDKKLRCKMYNNYFPVLTIVYETDIVNGIKEIAINNLKVFPNITNDNVTLTLDLETAGNLNITLIDLLGNEIYKLHNNFVDAETFIKTFSIEALPVGVYYIILK